MYCVLCIESFSEGAAIYGPFSDRGAAEDFADYCKGVNCVRHVMVEPLEEPTMPLVELPSMDVAVEPYVSRGAKRM